MPTITEPVPTGSRPIAVRPGQPLRLLADTACDWWQSTNGGAFAKIGSNVATLVWTTPTSVTRRFNFDRIEVGVVTTGAAAPSVGTLFLNLCESAVATLFVTDRIRNEATEEPPLHPDQLEGDDVPNGVPLAMPGANRDGMGTVLLERAREAGGPANLVSLYGPNVSVETSGKVGVRTPIGVQNGLGPFRSISTNHHGGFYFNYDFGKSRTLSLARFLVEDFANNKDVSVLRGDGRQSSFRYFNFVGSATYYTPAAGVQSTLLKSGSWFQEIVPSGTYFLYNAGGTLPGRLNRVIDRYGNAAYYTYDSGNRLQKVEGISGTASGLAAYLRYDGSGLCNALVLQDYVTPANDRTTYFQYDANRNLLKITGPELCVTYFEYGTGTPTTEFLTAVTDSLNRRWVVGYDANSRVNKVVDANGVAAYFDFDTATPITRWRDRVGKTTYFNFNAFGSPTFVTNVGTPSDYFRFDGDGNLTSTQNRLGQNWYFQYDSKGNRISSTDPLLSRSYFEYNSTTFTLRAFEDALARRTYLVHDATRNRTVQVDPLNRATYYTYKTTGLLQTRKDRRLNLTDFLTDAKANLTGVRDPLLYTTYFNYNSAGERTQTIDPLGRASSAAFDKKGRVVQTNDPLNNTRYFAYDAACNRTIEVDPRNVATYHSFDSDNNRSKTALDMGGGDFLATYFRYDAEDRLVGQKNARLNETVWTYDSLGRREREVDALGFASYWEYDAAHEPIKTRDKRLNTSYMDFDVAGRLQVQKDPYLNRSYFGFDKKGNRVLSEDPRGNKTYFTFNANDWQTHTTNAILAVSYMGYDEEGNRIFAQDPLFNRSYWSFDVAGRQTHARDAVGNQTYSAYDGARQPLLRLDQLLNATYFEFDTAGRQIKVKDAFLNFTYTLFDRSSNVLMSVDALGFATYFVYDNANRRTQTKDAFLATETTEFDRVSNVTRQVDKRGFATYWEYDPLDRRVQQADPVHFAKTYFGFDASGNQVITVDPLGFATYFTFDLANRFENTMDQRQAWSYTAYDASSNVVARRVDQGWGRQPWGSSPFGGERRSSYFEFDSLNRLRRAIDPPALTGGTAGFRYHHYDAANNKIMEVDQEGRPVYFGFDVLNRQERVRDGLASTSYMVFDARSSVTKRIDAEGRTAYFELDKLGRTFRQGNALGELTYFGFDPRGDRVVTINPRNFSTYFTFDRLRRVSHQKDALLGVRYFGFDAVGNTILQQDELFNRTYFSFDGLNRTIKTRDAANADTYFGYDARSSLVARQDADNRKTYFVFDGARRLSRQDFDSDPTLYYAYDTLANLTIVRDETGRGIQAFDALDRMIVKATLAGNVYFEFDKSGMKTKVIAPDGGGTYHTYDAVGLLSSVGVFDPAIGGGIRRTYYTFDKSHKQTVKRLHNGTVQSYYKYDVAGRINQLDNRDSTNAVISYFSYGRDANGNVTSTVREAGTKTYYTFDALDRIQNERWNTTGTIDNYYFAFDYDAASNRRTKLDYRSGGTRTANYYFYDSRNLMSKDTARVVGGSTTDTYYVYDNSQRLTKQYLLSAGSMNYFSFNQRNMVTQIQNFGGSDQNRYFTYNAVGERVVVADSSTGLPAYWSFDGSKLLQDKQKSVGAGTTATNYRHNEAPQEACLGSVVEQGLADNSSAFPAFDQSGSARNDLNPAAGVNDSYEQNFFGEQISAVDNFQKKTRAFSGSQLRGRMNQEGYFLEMGAISLPGKNIQIGGLVGPEDPMNAWRWLMWLAALLGGTACQDDGNGSGGTGGKPVCMVTSFSVARVKDRGVLDSVLGPLERYQDPIRNSIKSDFYDVLWRIDVGGQNLSQCSVEQDFNQTVLAATKPSVLGMGDPIEADKIPLLEANKHGGVNKSTRTAWLFNIWKPDCDFDLSKKEGSETGKWFFDRHRMNKANLGQTKDGEDAQVRMKWQYFDRFYDKGSKTLVWSSVWGYMFDSIKMFGQFGQIAPGNYSEVYPNTTFVQPAPL